ncbi:MmcQ/YjbR family DNA-binding protein [Paenibacillus sp. NFR01]|uniref:MmcQ/YjbR family DNA-binding protein n=1 Tax=Paenibacillus sp. NFR01 TaxID=1566279 RepID=UPI0008C21C5A|nr:MmcQ/YjbR family DNA-binding protein [Paenibacillus sp. NFR01]SET15665.1 Predicted DNA-binding protein, MmcQ/YjbR family [Paenibacillus sp. NFR01]
MTKDEIIEYCLTYASTYHDSPFDPTSTVVRHLANQKMFALIFNRGGNLCINLKCDPERSDFYRSAYAEITPGYHMNKEHWNTVILDGELSEDVIKELVKHSFDLTRPKIKVKKNNEDEA